MDGKEFLFGVSGTQKVIDIEGISSNALKGEVSVLENGKLLGSGVFNAGTMENIAGLNLRLIKLKGSRMLIILYKYLFLVKLVVYQLMSKPTL